MNVSEELARTALALTFEEIPANIVQEAKHRVLDTLGCAIGGYDSETSQIILRVVEETRSDEEATVIGSGLKTSCLNAALANGAMTRYLDFHDAAYIRSGAGFKKQGYHPSEFIPPILALGEWKHISGRETIACIVAAYDLSLRFLDAIVGAPMENRGWNGDIRGAYLVPVLAGRIMGLSERQIVNAVGISASCHAVLGILDADAEEYTMTKNVRFPTMACGGIMAAKLAQKGFTGPARVIEGQYGFRSTIMGGEYDLDRLLDNKTLRFTVADSAIKGIIADYSGHGHLEATLNLVKKHDIKPEDITEIRITTSTRCARHTGHPAKKYPANKETADHSIYYLTAIAIIDREVGPDQFAPEKYRDPRVLDLIDKVVVIPDPEMDNIRPAGSSEIVTKQGKSYKCRVDRPRGDPLNPMDDREIIAKFTGLARKHLSENRMQELINTVYELDKMDDVGQLAKLLVFDRM